MMLNKQLHNKFVGGGTGVRGNGIKTTPTMIKSMIK